MPRGPAPTPKKDLKARGSWRAKVRPDDLELEAKVPKMPTTLSRRAQAAWRYYAGILGPRGVLTEADRDSFALLCKLVAEEREFELEAKRLRTGSTDWKRIHVALKETRVLLKDLFARFGLTPADRPRIKMKEPDGGHGRKDKSRYFKSGGAEGRGSLAG